AEGGLDPLQRGHHLPGVEPGADQGDGVEIGRLRRVGPGRRAPPARAGQGLQPLAPQLIVSLLQYGLHIPAFEGQIAAHRNDDGFIPVHLASSFDRLGRNFDMTFYPTDKIALFIDGANLYSAARGLNFDIDYKKLLDEFRRRGIPIRAYYYTALVEGDDYS